MKNVAMVLGLGATGLVDQGLEMDRGRGAEEGGEKTSTGGQDPGHPGEADENQIHRQMGKDTLGQGEIEAFAKAIDPEAVVDHQMDIAIPQTRGLELASSGGDQRGIDIEPMVAPGLEVGDQKEPGPQRPAAYIHQPVTGLEPLLHQILALQPPQDLPFAPDKGPVLTTLDGLIVELAYAKDEEAIVAVDQTYQDLRVSFATIALRRSP